MDKVYCIPPLPPSTSVAPGSQGVNEVQLTRKGVRQYGCIDGGCTQLRTLIGTLI